MPILTVFRSRLKPGVKTEYDVLADEMSMLAEAMPGFVSEKTFTSADGERVTIVIFDDRNSHLAWRDHPRHRSAQEAGRTLLYAEYHVYSAEVDYEYSFSDGVVH